MMKKTVDLIINPQWIIPIVPRHQVYEELSIAIQSGRIVDVLPWAKCTSKYNAKEIINLENHVVLPGFVNAHTHNAMVLFKSYGDDNDLMDWLEHYIWPMEAKLMSKEFIQDGTKLACAEMIRSGTTCFNDMYYLVDEAIKVNEMIGMRAQMGLGGRDKNGTQSENIQTLMRTIHPTPLQVYNIGPHSTYMYSDKELQEISEVCRRFHISLIECTNSGSS